MHNYEYRLCIYCAYLQKKVSAGKGQTSKVKVIVMHVLTGTIYLLALNGKIKTVYNYLNL